MKKTASISQTPDHKRTQRVCLAPLSAQFRVGTTEVDANAAADPQEKTHARPAQTSPGGKTDGWFWAWPVDPEQIGPWQRAPQNGRHHLLLEMDDLVLVPLAPAMA